jgi:hypothetical protein
LAIPIKKILKVDYLRDRAMEYIATLISAKLKNEFLLFYPSVSHWTDISPKIQGRLERNLVASHEELFD